MPFDVTIDAFAAALADGARPAPRQTIGRLGVPDAKRFGVYRNNVAVGLIAALEARYPIVRRLVGDDFFRAMAGAFATANRPTEPVLIGYGRAFPDFVAGFEPARDLDYLADVARVENAWVEAYHAAEGEAIGFEALAGLVPEALPDARFALHPAARLLRLAHPGASIWAGHQGEGEARPPQRWGPEDALVTRPRADVLVRILPAGGGAFAQSLSDGATLAAATGAAGEGFDPGPHIVGLIEAGAIVEILPGDLL